MYVVATAGHVDHGKSTLVRALTGIEPDRWAEERRRGLTIDLGYAWTTLPSGRDVAFVDVPGHERFLGNMLAGLGPAPVVMFVVAVDEGWRAQSDDHRDAVAALGIDAGLLVLTRADRAHADRVPEVEAQARAELVGTGLADAPAVVVSATRGTGLDALRAALDDVLAAQAAPAEQARLRMWVDRSFSVKGAGTVVTGTLATGRLAVGERLDVLGPSGMRAATVRGLESQGAPLDAVGPVSRVGVNLRGVSTDDVRRGDALVRPGTWLLGEMIDVRRVSGDALDQAPEHLTVHVGTAAVRARLRTFDAEHARLTLERALPLTVGDRLVLRDPGARIVGGAQVLDAEPPQLRRRGDAARRAAALRDLDPAGDLAVEVARRGAVPVEHLRRLGLALDPVPPGVRVIAEWWLDERQLTSWASRLAEAVAEVHESDPLAIGLSRGASRELLALPADRLLDAVAAEAGLELDGGYVRAPGRAAGLGPAEAAVAELEARLAEQPFAAPEANDLAALGLGARELAAAERAGRLVRLGGGVVLLPTAPALAMRTLAALDQPFTTSAARQALDTTRRVVIPLLEHLDARGWTRRLDAGHRQVVRPATPPGGRPGRSS